MFQSFYRLDTARNLDETGVGLGLSIARDGIRIHGGKYIYELLLNRGTGCDPSSFFSLMH